MDPLLLVALSVCRWCTHPPARIPKGWRTTGHSKPANQRTSGCGETQAGSINMLFLWPATGRKLIGGPPGRVGSGPGEANLQNV